MTLLPHPTSSELPPIAVDELDDLAALRRLRPAWARLLAGASRATPFQSPEWLLPWTARFARGQVWVLAARRGERLVGLLPLRLVESGGVRTASFLGQGVSDYGGALVAGGSEGDGVLKALLGRLRDRRGTRWDQCDLDQLPPEDPLLQAPLPAGLEERRLDQDVCPEVALPTSAAALAAGLPHRLGPRIERSLRRLHRETRAVFERATGAGLEELLDAFFRLHAAEWQARGTTGVLADATLQTFHREVAAGMLEAGRLRLFGLRMDGQVRAVLYGFVQEGRFYSYLGGFDPRLSVLSPGTLMIWHAMTAAIDESVRAFDFLRGAEAYKYRWGARDRTNRRRLLR
jgi:CelD/BcsL family acetyltransferase involved in cellulose biosynthesis